MESLHAYPIPQQHGFHCAGNVDLQTHALRETIKAVHLFNRIPSVTDAIPFIFLFSLASVHFFRQRQTKNSLQANPAALTWTTLFIMTIGRRRLQSS